MKVFDFRGDARWIQSATVQDLSAAEAGADVHADGDPG